MDRGDYSSINLLAKYLVEIDAAKQELRNKGYGWTGMGIYETVQREIPDLMTPNKQIKQT